MRALSLTAFAVAALTAGCLDKTDPPKGELEDELPPGSPLAGPGEGKADGDGLRFTIAVESPHPYANGLDRAFPVALAGRVPSCATRARVHFASLRTEAGYDYVHVESPRGRAQSFDGVHDDTWSAWVDLDATLALTIRLDTDDSVTRDGFRIDSVEVSPTVVCPHVAIQSCNAGQLDTNPSRATCACASDMTCVANADVAFEHVIGGGFAGTVGGNRSVGTDAYQVTYKPGDPEVAVHIGTINHDRVQTVLRQIEDAKLLERADVSEWSNWNETLKVTVGATTRSITRAQGSFPAADAVLATAVDGLFSCEAGGALTCDSRFACEEGKCVEHSCVCTALYQPVCGTSGQTYSNGCAAACADAVVKHTGACGIDGDTCGTLLGRTCQDDFKCRYGAGAFEAPFPDAGGACVARTYCDAPADCAALPHQAVPGSWSCAASTCAWRAGVAWRAVEGFRYTSAHPYVNRASDFRQLYAPAGTAKIRLVVNGRFEMENNYDFLEVYNWSGTQWVLAKRYTGANGPIAADEFPGQYHYVRLVSDSSIAKYGFDVTAEYAN